MSRVIRRARHRRDAALLTALGCLLGLAACTGAGPEAAGPVPAVPSPSSSPAPAPGTSSRPSTGTTKPAESPAGSPSRPAGTTTAPARPQSSVKPGRWPKSLGEPTQGDRVWAVYLAVGHSSTDPAINKAVKQAAGVRYQAVIGDLACDDGGTQALRLDEFDYWTAATVYFADQSDARSFAASYQAKVTKPLGVARIGLGCLD
jgi:hypothetical protein